MVSEAGTGTDVRPGGRHAVDRGLWLGLDQASVMGVELLAATLTWTGLGYLADRWLGTTPWLLAIGAVVGNAAGIYLVWLRSARMEGGSDRPVVSVDEGAGP